MCENPAKIEKFDRLVKLAELAASRFDARRGYEWKIVLGFWLGMLTTLHKDWVIPPLPACGLAFTVFAFILWLGGVHVANRNDKNRYEHYHRQAKNCIQAGDVKPRAPMLSFWWAPAFQLLITIVLAWFIWDAHGAKTPAAPENVKTNGGATAS